MSTYPHGAVTDTRTHHAFKHVRAILACVALAVALLAPAAASASFTRRYESSLTETLTGPFQEPSSVAVDSSDNVWVGDPAKDVIAEFNSSGAIVREITESPSAIATSQSSGRLYVASGGKVSAFDESTGVLIETWPETFFELAAIAVDNSPSDGRAGDVYVAEDEYPEVVKLFDSTGKPVNFCGTAGNTTGNELTGPAPGENFTSGERRVSAMATDAHGDLYLALKGSGGGFVDELNPCGELIQVFTGPENAKSSNPQDHGNFDKRGLDGITIDPADGDVLIGEKAGATYEFRADGEYRGQVTNPPLSSAAGLVVDSKGSLYVADPGTASVAKFSPGFVPPTPALTLPGTASRTTAVLNGTVDTEGVAGQACAFEYVTQEVFEKAGSEAEAFEHSETASCEQPSAAELLANETTQAVHAEAGLSIPLTPGTTYRYRLTVTTDPAAGGGTSHSFSSTFTALEKPRVDSSAASNVSSSFVDLQAQIDPLGAQTTYQFQYVDAAAYEAALAAHAADPYAGGGTIPATPASIGSGAGDVGVLQKPGGLIPGTTYHFRVVAVNQVGETPGPDGMFTTLAAPVEGLPDGRGYELLTPPNKGSAEDMFGSAGAVGEERNFDMGYASNDGEGFMLLTTAAFGPDAVSGTNAYVFRRSEDGWRYRSDAPPIDAVQTPLGTVPDMSDFSRVAISDRVGSGADRTALKEVDEVGSPGGEPEPFAPISEGPYVEGRALVEGASANLDTVVVSTWCKPGVSRCLEGQDPNTLGLEEWRGGELRRVDVKSDGSPVSACGAILGQGERGTHNAVSADGSKIFFNAPDPQASGAGCWGGRGSTINPPELYMRLDGEKTVEVSAPAGGFTPTRPLQVAVYVGASADGSKVFFMSESELTKDGEGIDDPELYEYDTETETLTRISHGESGDAVGDVHAVPAISADGSAVYFMAGGKLTKAPAPPGGLLDLYRYDTVTGVTSFVATVEPGDYPGDLTGHWWEWPAEEVAFAPQANWYATPDGRFLLFGSKKSLTGYDTKPAPGAACPNIHNSQSGIDVCTELYRYDASSGSLICVSCDPSGAAPVSNAEFARSGVPQNPQGGVPRGISDDGSYVFFDSADPLVPQATNGKLNVYEWREGKLGLISPGSDAYSSFFLDSSPDGSNVFFGTHAQLSPRDTDSAGDLYDARVGGGERALGETAQCEGDACQPPPATPLDRTPASLSFSGAGNVSAAAAPPAAPAPRASGQARRRVLLAKALKACTKQRSRHVRVVCERHAHKRYGSAAKASAGPVKSSGKGGR